MKNTEHRPDPGELLEAFVNSKRSERAFADLVEGLSKLVFSSALRRTSSPQLAEEITQNVFALLARKAVSLQHHPALLAWILETTKRQAASAMRAERRRLRKIAALTNEATAQDSGAPNQMDNPVAWKEAVPLLDEALDRLPVKERNIILQRFYEGKKFREIAATNRETEGACKKRAQRALEKLTRMLSARGVTLSTTVIASALGTELARSAPIQTAAVMAPKALAVTSSNSISTLFTETFHTMSKLKTTTVTVAVVVALAVVPFSQQLAETNRIQSKLQTVTSQPAASQQGAAKSMRTRVDRNQKIEGRSAGSLLASLEGPIDNRAFIRHMMVILGIPDPLAQTAVVSRLQQMSLDERKNLIRALKNFPMDKATKNGLATKILDLAPEMSPREKMEELAVWGRSMSHQYMNGWAASDPDAAMQWFWEKRASGELDRGLGPLGRNLYESTLNDLLRGVAGTSPAKALDLYGRLPQEEINPYMLRNLAGIIARVEIQRGDPRHSKEMLDTHSGSQRKAILKGVLGAHASEGLFDEGMAIVDGYIQSPSEREEYLKNIFGTGLPFWKLGSGLDWLVTSTPENEAPAVMRTIVQTATFNSRQKTLEWVESKGPGAIRDHAYAGWIEQLLDSTFADDFPRVLPAAEMIEDPALRTEIRQLIRTKWNEQDKAQISQYLPTSVLEKLENLSARNPSIR